MFDNRRIPQATHARRSGFLATLTATVSLAVLVACAPADEDTATNTSETEQTGHEVVVTAAFTGVDGGADSIVFVPNAQTPSQGLVVTATREGGLDIFDADGELRTRHAGARLAGLAAAPSFQLRGSDLPLVFGAVPDSDQVLGYAILAGDDIQVLDLPLAQMEAPGGVAGLCRFREGAGYIELAVLGTGATAEIWRVRDAGEEQLTVESVAQFALPAPARQCVALDGDLYLASPASGIARVDPEGNLHAQRQAVVANIAVGEFNGARLVLVDDGNSGTINAYYANDFSDFGTVTINDGLSTPGVSRPGAMAVTLESYGFTAYSAGMVAVFDMEDQRVKVVSREAFARALVTSPVE
jgi:myo-inositol-hexaphosphate 3-phosphohydrolase